METNGSLVLPDHLLTDAAWETDRFARKPEFRTPLGYIFSGTCRSREVGEAGVFINAVLVINIDSFEQITSRIARLRLRGCRSMPVLTVFVAYAPTSSYDEDEIEALCMDLGKFYRGSTQSMRSSLGASTQTSALGERLKNVTSVLIAYVERTGRKAV